MQDIKGFRRYFNDHLHAELVAFERYRIRLVLLITFGVVTMSVITLAVILMGVLALSIFLVIPWWVLWIFIQDRIRRFKGRFKPLVIRSMLNFIDPRLKYYHEEEIAQDTFKRSDIFPNNPVIYEGEDYIMGNIGEVFFEMCELTTYAFTGTQAKLNKTFEGIFFHAAFNTNFKGRIVMFPRDEWQHFIKTIKGYTRYAGTEIKDVGSDAFKEHFMVYTEPEVHYKEILTDKLLDTITKYELESHKKVYASFIDNHFYVAIAEPYDLLEAHIFYSNVNFELLATFYEELYLFTRLVEDFDIGH